MLKSQGEKPGRESGRCEGTEPRGRWWPCQGFGKWCKRSGGDMAVGLGLK